MSKVDQSCALANYQTFFPRKSFFDPPIPRWAYLSAAWVAVLHQALLILIPEVHLCALTCTWNCYGSSEISILTMIQSKAFHTC